MVAPINSVKHFVPRPAIEISAGARFNMDAVKAVVAPGSAIVQNVIEGAIVKAIHIELWMIHKGLTALTTQFILTVEKVPVNAILSTFSNMLNLQAYNNKKNILYTTQGVIGSSVDGPTIPIIRNWILIPKGKQRMGLGDQIIITVATVTQDLEVCGMFIYKEYR